MADYSATRAREWFKTEEEFLEACRDAVSLASGERDEEFAQDIMKRAKQYKLEMFLTQKQLVNLCRIADRVPPIRRT